MKWQIKTNDKEVCKEVMDEFAKVFTEEYTAQINKLRYRPVKKFLPDLMPVVFMNELGVIFAIPMKLPEFKKLRQLISKLTGRPVGSPKWQQKTKEMLEGCLTVKGVKFDSIEYVGD